MTVARRLLTHVALGTAFVVAVVTAVTYDLVYDALEQRDLRHLDTYVAERAQREEARFQQVQSNLTLARAQFLSLLAKPYPADLQERWNERFLLFPDGAWRSRKEFSDGRIYSALWAHKNAVVTPEWQREILVAQDLCDEMLPGWVESFPSIYFNFHGPANIGFDARIASWVWDMPADYDADSVEWLPLALPKVPPLPDVFSWTGVQKDAELDTENPLINSPLVSVFLPIYKDGSFLGSVGHDIFMTGMLDEATHSGISGATHCIFRNDGRLIAHPMKKAAILASKGLLTAEKSGDATLASLYRICSTHSERRFAGFDTASDVHYSVARLAGPEWVFATMMPRAVLKRQASESARWVLWSGLVSVALVLGFLAAILRTQIARPLAGLTRATKAISAGAATVPLPITRADELGELAASFREMIAKVAAREGDLRELNSDLERRVLERTEELHRALAHEKELGEMKGNFVSLVSHEFRTPLGVIMSAVEVLQRYFERLPADKRARHLEMIFRSTRNLANLIEEVLLLGRVEEGRMQFTPTPLDLEALCRTLADELFSATGAACPIQFRAPTSLDGAVSDEAVLRHILPNLLSNAVKYSEPGTPVEFTAERRHTDVIFTIRDRGIGIPREDQARLFTSFTRARNVGSRPGTGLGLVIVQRCVHLHGGDIAIKSEVGVGTTVTVTLPVFTGDTAP
jgi:signal transduction histidine kinase